MLCKIRAVLWAVLFLAGIQEARADLITFTWSGSADGSLNGNAFLNTPFVITGTADTDYLINSEPVFFLENGIATVSVSGIGTDTFNIFTQNVVNHDISAVGISSPNDSSAILFMINPALASYDLISSIGPISGASIFNPGFAFETAGGSFVLDNVIGNVTFQASTGQAVPEPSSLALGGFSALGLLCYAGWRRRMAGQKEALA